MSKAPTFYLKCINSKYPKHLVLGMSYKVMVGDKNKKGECPVYWYHPMETDNGIVNKFVNIGNFHLTCFNIEPVRKWIAEQKGVPYTPPQRQAQVIEVPRQRQRQPVAVTPAPRQRQQEPAPRQRQAAPPVRQRQQPITIRQRQGE